MSINGYTLGAPVRLSASFTNAAGVATDATISLTIRTPDGVETDASSSVAHDSTGNYHADYATTQVGEHFARWVASGALTAAYEEQFQVLRSAF